MRLALNACGAFPTHGNTHLPWWARGPLWRSSSGHFFPFLYFMYPPRLGYIRVAAPFWIPSKVRPFPGSPSGSSPLANGSPFIPRVLGHTGCAYLQLTLPSVARSPQVVCHTTHLPWLGFSGGQRWWQFSVIWMPQFSNLDAEINNKWATIALLVVLEISST